MIRVEGLRKSFGDVRAVNGVDLHVERGQILVLLGQNGAGKSTTLRCLGGILRPDAGLIELDGLRVPEKLDEVRARLGVVPDQARLYGRNTAVEYLDHFGYLYGVPADVRARRIATLLERFELADRTDTILAAYSRGMAQKVALIRATLHDPDWIFCDEPTAGLDPVAAADMRHYLGEQRARGAALIVTTHVLGEAELMADRIAIMRRGVIVTHGTLDELRREAGVGRRFAVRLSRPPTDPDDLKSWLKARTLAFELDGERITYSLDWHTAVADRADFAAELQKRLASEGTPYYELEERQTSIGSVYLKAMDEPLPEPVPVAAAPARVISGIGAPRMFSSLRNQWPLLRHSLPFYVSSWWRRGDLSWVMYLNAFVLLLVAATSLFGQLPGVGSLAQRLTGGVALQAGLLLPLFFMSFALLESIKSSIGIWWEKAQQSLEVLLYTPVDDPSLIWLEVLPGAVVSAVWVTFWMAAGMTLLSLFGQSAPWDLLPVFAFVAAVTAYWAAMGRMLGFMLFPREGAAGGAWSFLLSPVSAAVADLPLALFVFARYRLAFAAADGVLRAHRSLWRHLRSRTPHGDRHRNPETSAHMAADRSHPPQRGCHRCRPRARGGPGRHRRGPHVERQPAFLDFRVGVRRRPGAERYVPGRVRAGCSQEPGQGEWRHDRRCSPGRSRRDAGFDARARGRELRRLLPARRACVARPRRGRDRLGDPGRLRHLRAPTGLASRRRRHRAARPRPQHRRGIAHLLVARIRLGPPP